MPPVGGDSFSACHAQSQRGRALARPRRPLDRDGPRGYAAQIAVEKPILAFYYPGWIWQDPAWLKNLLLFFDGVALLVPDYMRERARKLTRR
jgi:hypothetical protein